MNIRVQDRQQQFFYSQVIMLVVEEILGRRFDAAVSAWKRVAFGQAEENGDDE